MREKHNFTGEGPALTKWTRKFDREKLLCITEMEGFEGEVWRTDYEYVSKEPFDREFWLVDNLGKITGEMGKRIAPKELVAVQDATLEWFIKTYGDGDKVKAA